MTKYNPGLTVKEILFYSAGLIIILFRLLEMSK